MRGVDLLPRDEPRAEARLRPLPSLAAAAAALAVAGGVLLAAASESASVADRRVERDAARAVLARIPQVKPISAAQARLAGTRSQRVAALGDALSRRLPWDAILRQVAAALPADVWLASLGGSAPAAAAAAPPEGAAPAAAAAEPPAPTGSAPAAAPASAPASAGDLVLDGYTYAHPSVAVVLSRLAALPTLRDVRLVRSELAPTPAGARRVHFQIAASVRTRSGS